MLKTEKEYEAALREIDRLWDAEPDTMEGAQFLKFVCEVGEYENEHYPIPAPSKWDRIIYRLQSRRWF